MSIGHSSIVTTVYVTAFTFPRVVNSFPLRRGSQVLSFTITIALWKHKYLCCFIILNIRQINCRLWFLFYSFSQYYVKKKKKNCNNCAHVRISQNFREEFFFFSSLKYQWNTSYVIKILFFNFLLRKILKNIFELFACEFF